MELYIADIRVLPYEKLWEKCRILPGERRERIAKYRNREDQMRGLAAGLLLEYGCNRQGLTLREDMPHYRNVLQKRHTGGKPYLDGEKVYFNLSHAGDYAAAVFSTDEVGVDIEQRKRAKQGQKLARRFFQSRESELLEGLSAEESARVFLKLWTRKESYLKAVGTGLRAPMDVFSVLEDSIGAYNVKSWEMPEGYEVSVCAKERILCEPEYIDLSVEK